MHALRMLRVGFILLTVGAAGCRARPAAGPTTPSTPVATSTTPRANAPADPLPDPLHLAGAVSLPNGSGLDYTATIRRTQDGYEGHLDIPAQGVAERPLSKVDVSKDRREISFVFEVLPPARWTGSRQDDGSFACRFEQGVELPCTMASVTEAELAELGPRRPQTPRPPFPYRAEDVEYRNAEAGITLAGTLTVPEGAGPFPAAVLITGSGAQDRDETIFAHKPFAVIADHLTRRGIAVLRSDDRGIGGSEAGPAGPTTEDFAGDVRSAIALLRSRSEVDSKRIGLIGHSEGGIIAPMIAAKDRKVAFVVMLAGSGVPGDEIIERQVRLAVLSSGGSEAQAASAAEQQRHILDIVTSTANDDEAHKALRAKLGSGPQLDAQIEQVTSPWYRYFLGYDPRPALKKVKAPVLALIGGLDTQVDPEQNLPVIERALRRHRDATVQRIDGVNHLFQPAKTGSVTEYTQIEQTIALEVLELLAAWLDKRVGGG